MDDSLERSRKNGPHALLPKLVGKWEGVAKTWFEPGKLADTSPIKGRIRLTLGDLCLLHEYRGKLMGSRMHGLAMLAYSLQEQQWQAAWMDTVHNGTRIMCSRGDGAADPKRPDVRGSYPAGEGPDWGWRTEIDLRNKNRLVIRHYNIPPGGEEYLGVEFDYRRVS